MDKPLSAPFGWMATRCASEMHRGRLHRRGGKSRLRATLATFIPEQDKPLRERKLQRYVALKGASKSFWRSRMAPFV